MILIILKLRLCTGRKDFDKLHHFALKYCRAAQAYSLGTRRLQAKSIKKLSQHK